MPRCIAHVVRFHPPICRNWGVHFFIKWLRDETKFAYEFFVCARHEWKISWEPLAGLRANDSNKPMSDSHMCVCFLQLFTRERNIYIYFTYFIYFFKASIAENRHERISQEFGCKLISLLSVLSFAWWKYSNLTMVYWDTQLGCTRKRNWISDSHASLLFLLCPILPLTLALCLDNLSSWSF